jgi:hypothetical protein
MATGETRYGAGDVLAVPAVAKGGRQISVEFTIILLKDSEQRISGVAAILRDVTARFEELQNWRVVAPTRMPLDDRDDIRFRRRTAGGPSRVLCRNCTAAPPRSSRDLCRHK